MAIKLREIQSAREREGEEEGSQMNKNAQQNVYFLIEWFEKEW